MKKTIAIATAMLLSLAAALAQDVYTDRFQNGDPIPDYSRVGYHWGDREIPDVPVTRTVTAPKNGEDATELIQKALDEAKAPGAVLLKAGTYNVSGTLHLRRSGIVLRGEGNRTVVVATGTGQRSLLVISAEKNRPAYGKAVDIVESVPVGRMWVRVADASSFKAGDRIMIRRTANDKWIHDLKMDVIPERKDGGATNQWAAKEYNLTWERIVTKVEGDRIWLENPVVMEITPEYSIGQVQKFKMDRITECGVEDIAFVSEYDASKVGTYHGQDYCLDEDHGWVAISVNYAEHGWIRRCTSKYFGYAIVSLNRPCKNFSVLDCHSSEPVSIITGGRRYAFNLGGGQLNFFDGCTCEGDRHQFVTGARVCGPNVYHRCTATNSFSDCGPHHRWSTGVLYDCVVVDGRFDCEDRGNAGSGHGWAGANFIFWNCEAGMFALQSPWVSAKNYAVGCVGPRHNGSRRDNQDRPQGVWESYDSHVSPESLYEYQLAERRKAGIKAVPTDN
jgi:hypothetical protein